MMNVRNRGLFCSTINSEMLFDSSRRKEDLFFFTVYLQPNTHRSLIVVENSAFLMTLIAKIAALVWGEVSCSETLALIHSFGASQRRIWSLPVRQVSAGGMATHSVVEGNLNLAYCWLNNSTTFVPDLGSVLCSFTAPQSPGMSCEVIDPGLYRWEIGWYNFFFAEEETWEMHIWEDSEITH